MENLAVAAAWQVVLADRSVFLQAKIDSSFWSVIMLK
jgi:hypothetical protein